MKQVEILFSTGADRRIEPDRREVQAPVDYNPNVLHREASLKALAMEGSQATRRSHANVRASSDGRAP